MRRHREGAGEPSRAHRLLATGLGVEGLLLAALLAVSLGSDGLRWPRVLGAAALAWLAVVSALLGRVGRDLRDSSRLAADRGDQLRALDETSHYWIWQATADLQLTHTSRGVTDLLGLEPGAVRGRSLLEFLAPEDVEPMLERVATARRTGAGWSDVPFRWRTSVGTAVSLHASAAPVLGAEGELMGFRGTIRRAVYDASEAELHVRLARRTRLILTERSISVALQPIIDVGTRRWIGVEALARFPDGRPPDEVFAEAHASGLGVDLELLALESALSVARHLPSGVHLSVNASPMLILDPGFARVLHAHAPLLGRVVLEITEHAVVDRYGEIHAVLQPLRERGMRLAVDDTGGGYASFSHVLRLRPDVIKLDRSLIADAVGDPAVRALVTAVVLVALEMDASVTAEGIETAEALQVVGSLGVDSAQGYLIGKPTTDRRAWQRWQTADWPFSDLPALLPGPARRTEP